MAATIQAANSKAKTSHKSRRIRVATYNVHKCRGMDGRIRPDRIVEVLREIDADIVALQEVVCRDGRRRHDHQARYVAEELGYHAEIGENRRYRGGAYGNVLLSRLPIHYASNHDLSIRGRERRGCLRADVRLGDSTWLHLFNLHLGTAVYERRIQTRELIRQQMFTDSQLVGAKIVLGDLNEWKRGLPSELLTSHFENAQSQVGLDRVPTYPGFMPMLALDYIYFDRTLRLHGVAVHRSRMALVASDHLPVVAEFSLPVSVASEVHTALPRAVFPPPATCSIGCHVGQ